jgi:DNA polymerase-3 subunit epsilon
VINSIVICDVETTGLDAATCETIEIGAALYDVAHRCVVESFATLVRAEANPCEDINRIPAGALAGAAVARCAWDRLDTLVTVAGSRGPAIFMAHRASFDQSFVTAGAPEVAARLPWVCSKFDIEWPRSKPGASCVEMALAHGVPVVSAHRALTDVMLIAKTLESVQADGHDLGAMLVRAMRPKVLFVAQVSYDEREKAKAAGFGWDAATKTWSRRMAREDVASLGFRVREVSP